MVDIAWLPLLHRAAIVEQHSCYDFLKRFPKVKQWQRNLLTTGITNQSVPTDFEERFMAFYLSDSTYLGHLAQSVDREDCCSSAECYVEDMACCA